MDNRSFINLTPGKTFLDRLTGKTKVRIFLILIILLIATWDIRIIFPTFILCCVGLVSVKPNWKTMFGIMGVVAGMNLLNLAMLYAIKPDYGATICGGSTVLFQFTDFYIVTAETMWYFFVRFFKMFGSFMVALVFVSSITPSELAAGLYAIGVPHKICTIFSLTFRYIPDITKDFKNIEISMQTRGMELDPKKVGLGERLKQKAIILVPLIITSFDRISNIANAMDLRGFGKNKKRTYYCEHEETADDKKMKIFYIALLLFTIGVIVMRFVAPGAYEVWCPWIV